MAADDDLAYLLSIAPDDDEASGPDSPAPAPARDPTPAHPAPHPSATQRPQDPPARAPDDDPPPASVAPGAFAAIFGAGKPPQPSQRSHVAAGQAQPSARPSASGRTVPPPQRVPLPAHMAAQTSARPAAATTSAFGMKRAQGGVSDRSQQPDEAFRDPLTGLHVIKPVFSLMALRTRFELYQYFQLGTHPAAESREGRGQGAGGDQRPWGTVGVLVEKKKAATTKTGGVYHVWGLRDAHGNSMTLFLFGDAVKAHGTMLDGTVLAIFDARVRAGKGDTTISVDRHDQIIKVGRSGDFTHCRGADEDGAKCRVVVASGELYCRRHLKARKDLLRRSRRPDVTGALHVTNMGSTIRYKDPARAHLVALGGEVGARPAFADQGTDSAVHKRALAAGKTMGAKYLTAVTEAQQREREREQSARSAAGQQATEDAGLIQRLIRAQRDPNDTSRIMPEQAKLQARKLLEPERDSAPDPDPAAARLERAVKHDPGGSRGGALVVKPAASVSRQAAAAAAARGPLEAAAARLNAGAATARTGGPLGRVSAGGVRKKTSRPAPGSFAAAFAGATALAGAATALEKKRMMMEAAEDRAMRVVDHFVEKEVMEEGENGGKDPDEVQAYYCLTCRTWSQYRPKKDCLKWNHKVEKKTARQRWFRCVECRAIECAVGTIVPSGGCRKCGAVRCWKACERPQRRKRALDALLEERDKLQVTVDGQRHDYDEVS
ncbi:unnamed protein product [Pedinophyceae sp. YPF-701]|nr:unnamed protein product [Pedinophyceae sp. YPF-701]